MQLHVRSIRVSSTSTMDVMPALRLQQSAQLRGMCLARHQRALSERKVVSSRRQSASAAVPPSRLRCRAAAGDNSSGSSGESEPALSEEQLKQMEEDFLKEFVKGMGADDPESLKYKSKGTLNHQQVVKAMQMGSWRLKGLMDPPFEAVEAQIEGMWREILGKDLKLYPLNPEFKYCDSMDPLKESGEQSYKDLQDPERGDPQWPRMQLENRCYSSRVFRKLHMELVHRQDGFQVLHCVMFPRLEFDMPIFGMDIVGIKGKISLAVIDCSPVAMDRSLPPAYQQAMRALQAEYNMENNRKTPEWGAAIFSDLCIITRPASESDLADFIKYSLALSRLHMQLARLATPVQTNRARRLADISAAHERYSLKQLENDKTTRVLEAGFGKEFSARYMEEVMFDYNRAVEETLRP